MIDEPTDDNEERPTAFCPECGADHEVEPCALGCSEEVRTMDQPFSLRSHPRRIEIDALAREIERQDGALRTHAVLIALRELGLIEEADSFLAELDAQREAA